MADLLKFVESMDQHSVDVIRPTPEGPRMIAYLQWHPERAPRIVPLRLGMGDSFTLDEMRQMTKELEKRHARARGLVSS